MPIPSQEENPLGFHGRYKISKANGDPVDANAEYLVLRLDDGGSDQQHIKACRIAAIAYANAIEHYMPELAEDLRERYGGVLLLDWAKAKTHFDTYRKIYQDLEGTPSTNTTVALRLVFDPLAMRYNDGERTQVLYDEMMAVE
jgi:hypothetical protein